MRILFLGINYWPEQIGIGLYSGDMCTSWAAMGHEVRAIVAAPYYPAWKVFDGYAGQGWARGVEEGVDLTRCPIYVPAEPTGLKRIVHHVSFFASSLLPMLKAAIGGRPDVVFTSAPSLIASPVAWLAARLSGAKCWLHIQDFEVEAALATGLVKQGVAGRLGAGFERTVFALFDRVSSISPQMCRKLEAKGVPPGKVYELRNWADIERIAPLAGPSPYRDEWGIATPYVALYSGNIANKQGIDIVVDAARLLRHRQDLTFVVCGEGPNRANLEGSAADLANIRFHDLQPRERLNELLGMATAHLMPQLAGAADLLLPSKLTNMLASGRPVAATAASGTGLAYEVEGCGLITPPGDIAAFAQAIERLLDDPVLAAQFTAAARARAEERWARQPILERAMVRMERLASGGGPGDQPERISGNPA
jgi:colanic acid biosynthesis glycosyl transferase WcaI